MFVVRTTYRSSRQQPATTSLAALCLALSLARPLPAEVVAAPPSAPLGALFDAEVQEAVELPALVSADADTDAAVNSGLPAEAGGARELPAPTNPDREVVSTPPEDLPPAVNMDDILRRLEALEKSSQPTDAEAIEKKKQAEAKSAEKTAAAEWVDMSTQKWDVKLGGHMQLDYITWADTEPQVPEFNYVEFRRLRLDAVGVGYGVYDFRLQIDIEPESGDGTDRPVTDIKDAYLTMNELPSPLNRWRIGNFFVPYGLEQVTNDTNNIFLERSIPTQGIFTADREVGMAFYGVNDAKDVTWSFGTFIDSLSESLKERIDDNQGQRVSGRVTYCPYYDEPSNGRYMVHTGAGILYTQDQDGIARFRARPQIHEGPFLIDSGPLAAGEYTSGNLEFATVRGPFAVQSEAFLCNVNLVGDDSAWLWGAYLHCSYFLTGENRVFDRYGQHGAQFGRQQVYSNFFWIPGCCGPGAWEMKARWSNLTLTDVDAGQYNDLTLGFNWYWSDRIRIMFDYIHPVTSDNTQPFGATTSDIIGMRFDYNF
jgi:phosphate-selective porin OprO/OprP